MGYPFTFIPLSAPASGRGGGSLEECIPDPNSTGEQERAMEKRDAEITLSVALRRLSARSASVIILRKGLFGYRPHTLLEISISMRLSKERIRQLETRSLLNLKRILVLRIPPLPEGDGRKDTPRLKRPIPGTHNGREEYDLYCRTAEWETGISRR